MANPDSTINTKHLAGYFRAKASKFNYSVADIPAERLTHVIYAFAGISTTGECVSNTPADDQVNFPELLKLKRQHPQLKTLISVGGASSAARYTSATNTPAGVQKLAQSSVQYMKDNGFDGIDIDWEFPTAQQKQTYTALLVALRTQLDAHRKRHVQRYSRREGHEHLDVHAAQLRSHACFIASHCGHFQTGLPLGNEPGDQCWLRPAKQRATNIGSISRQAGDEPGHRHP